MMLSKYQLHGWLLVVAFGLICPKDADAAAAEIDFYRDVYSFLKANCVACHNKTTTKGGLNMESPETIRTGGDTGPGVVPGKSKESLILQSAAHTGDYVMPPPSNNAGAIDLTPAELKLLAKWIDQGAKNSVQQRRTVAWQPLAAGVHPIYSVAITRDARLAACGRSNQLFVYDLATRQLAARLVDGSLSSANGDSKDGAAHRALVQSIAFSPDGDRLATGSFREVKIWRRQQPEVVVRKPDPALAIKLATLSHDGKQIAALDATGSLHVIQAATGKAVRSFANVKAANAKSLVLNPDFTQAAVYGADSRITVWSVQDGKQLATTAAFPNLRAVALTQDGKQLLGAGVDGQVRVWSLPAGPNGELAEPKLLKAAAKPISAFVSAGAPNRWFIASEDGKVRLFDVSENKAIREYAVAGVLTLALAPDGKQFAAGCTDGAIRIIDVESAKPIIELRGDVGSNRLLAAQERAVAAAALEVAFQKREVARTEAESKSLDEQLKKAKETIETAKKNAPEKQKAAATAHEKLTAAQKAVDDVAALIAKAPDGKPDAALEKQRKETQANLDAAETAEESARAAAEAVMNHIKDAEELAASIATARVDNDKEIKNVGASSQAAAAAHAKATADLAAAKKSTAKEIGKPLSLVFSANAQLLAGVFHDRSVRVWATASAAPVDLVGGAAPLTAASIVAVADGVFSATGADGCTTIVNENSHWALERVLGGDKPDSPFADRVYAVCFNPDGKTLAVGSGEPSRSGDVSLWDIENGKLQTLWKDRHADMVLGLDFSPDGKRLASGGADKMARVVDIATGKQTALLEGHTHHVMGVAFRADGRVLATAGADNAVNIWDMLSGERKKKIEGWRKEVTSVQFVGATTHILTSAGDNIVRIIGDEGAVIRSIADLPDFMQSAASAENTIIAGGEDGVLRVWDRTTGQPLATFQ